MTKTTTKVLVALAVVALTSFGYVSSASARLNSQISLGGGIKCYFVPQTQADGSVVYVQVCGKVGP
jgi:hypothetical protein